MASSPRMGQAWINSQFAREADNQYDSNGGETMVKKLKVKNWEQHQHYKDRSPPWIKLHGELLADYDFTCLPDTSKLHLIAIWLLARLSDGIIPNDPKWVKKCAGLDGDVDLTPLIERGFLVPHDSASSLQHSASNLLATCAPEERRGEAEKRRGRGADRPTVSASPVPPDGTPQAIADQAASAYQARRYKTPNPRAAYYPVLLQEVADVFEAVADKDAALKLFLQTCETSPLPKDASFSDLAKSCGLKKHKAKSQDRPSQQYKDYTAERLARSMDAAN